MTGQRIDATAGRDAAVAGRWSNWIFSCIVCVVTACFFLGLSTRFWHWFIVPVVLGGIIIGRDGIAWLRGQLDVFDPVGLIGLFGLHYFLLAPLLHVGWDFWWDYRFNPFEWRPWLGYMALLNLAGLIGYRFVRTGVLKSIGPPRTFWRLDERRAKIVLPVALLLTGLMQVVVYINFGGLASYIHTYEDSLGVWGNAFIGYGWQFTISESFPILSALSYILIARKRPFLRTVTSIALFLAAQFVLELIFGGLRGSRNNVVFGLFWTVGLIHLHLRPITRRQILLGMLVLFAYMNVYFFYKHGGLDGLLSIGNVTSRDVIVGKKRAGNEQKFILLHDFGRSDIQALALYLLNTGADYKLAKGRTYLGGMASVIPRAIWTDRPMTVRKERTELLHGSRSPSRTYPEAQVPWIFGAPGEAMLNFGPFGAPIPFLVWGFAVGWVALLFRRMPRDDTRTLFLPLLVGMSLVLFIADSHIVCFFLVKDGLVPFVAIWLSSTRIPASRARKFA